MNVLIRWNRECDRLMYAGTAASAILFFLLVLTTVLSRYVLHRPLLASVELSRLFFIWSCYFAAALAFRRGAHIRFTILLQRWSGRVQRWVERSVHGCIMLFSALLCWQSLWAGYTFRLTELPMLGIPQTWMYAPVPLVALTLATYALELLMRDSSEKQ